MIKREKGAISVEAMTILMIFMFGMLALMSLINMVRSQVFIQNALNQSAKEVSQYSYILYRFGYIDYLSKTGENEAEFDSTVNKYSEPDKVGENLVGLMDKFNNDGGSSIIDEVVKGLFAKGSNLVTDEVNNYMIQTMAKSAMEEYIDSLGGDEFLKRIGVKDAKLNYSGIYCKDTNNEIVLCVEYQMEYKFPFINLIFNKPIRLYAYTTAWTGGIK